MSTLEQDMAIYSKDPDVIKRAFPDERDVVTRTGIDPINVMTPAQLAAYAEWQTAIREMKAGELAFNELKRRAQEATAKMAELATTP